MLGKLMKFEWKEMSRVLWWILGGMLLMTLLGIIGFSIPLGVKTQTGSADNLPSAFLTLSMVSSAILYVIMLMAVSYGVLIYFGWRFYRKMYTDEGYLTLTFPVGHHQLLLSKILVSAIMYFIIMVFLVVSILVLTITTLQLAFGSAMVTRFLSVSWQSFCALIRGEVEPLILHMFVAAVFLFVVSPFTNITILFGSLTIGQLASKHRGKLGIIAYIGILMGMSVVTQLVSFVMLTQLADHAAQSYVMSYDFSIGFNLAGACLLYFVMYRIISRKLDLH